VALDDDDFMKKARAAANLGASASPLRSDRA
jgi:hypothetical protein